MTAEEAIAYIRSVSWRGSPPGLARIRNLLRALGDPQTGMKFVHVAGTNGKGSTCACIASVLQAAGYRVGLDTSPYLAKFNERIRVNGELISDVDLAALTEELRPAAESLTERPTEFELITALALLYFQRCSCDIVVLEVGLGGELDSTNVIDVPEVAVITAMGMDHMRELGPTLADIAGAKAGIIKPGGTVISYGGCPEADAVFRRVCAQRGAELIETDFSRLHLRRLDLDGAEFDFPPHGSLRLPLPGTYQPKNAAVALTALEALARKGWNISGSAVASGLAAVRWPGRFEKLRSAPVFLLDGAHNPQGAAAAAESLRSCLPGQKVVFLVGVMADKDVDHILAPLAPLALAFVAVRPDNERAMSAGELAARLRPFGAPVQACDSVAEGAYAAAMAAGSDGVVCALGSLYFSAEVRRAAAELDAYSAADEPLS